MGLDKIKQLSKIKNISLEELSEISGVPKSTVNKIINGVTENPGYKTILSLAHALSLTADEFIELLDLDLKETKLTMRENSLINTYRDLTPSGKILIDENIKSVFKYERQLSQSHIVEIDSLRKTVPLLGIVSAGNGIENFFDKEDVEVENDCHFALIVRGDSMEPAYHDGQIIGIKKQNALENGEIGIVEWTSEDGSRKAYLKKWYQMNGHIKLVSLNKDYDDIIIEKGKIEVRGKVAN